MIKKIEKGYSFALGNRIGGYLAQALGVYIIIYNIVDVLQFTFFSLLIILAGLLCFFVGSSLSYAREYLTINYQEGSVKNVLNILGFEFKKKNNLTKYSNVSIISRRFTYSDEYEEALELGETVAKHTGKPLVKYAPKRLNKKARR